MGMLIVGLIGAIACYFWLRQRDLGRDRDQHHLASMLISVAAGQDEVGRGDIIAMIREKKFSRAQARVRLAHAVKLCRTAVSGALHDRVVALVREINASL